MNLPNFRWLYVPLMKCCEILLIFLSCGERWVGNYGSSGCMSGWKEQFVWKETLHQALKLKGIYGCSAIPDKKEVSLI